MDPEFVGVGFDPMLVPSYKPLTTKTMIPLAINEISNFSSITVPDSKDDVQLIMNRPFLNITSVLLDIPISMWLVHYLEVSSRSKVLYTVHPITTRLKGSTNPLSSSMCAKIVPYSSFPKIYKCRPSLLCSVVHEISNIIPDIEFGSLLTCIQPKVCCTPISYLP